MRVHGANPDTGLGNPYSGDAMKGFAQLARNKKKEKGGLIYKF